MKNLRILMIASEFPPKAAGIGNAVYNLCINLVKKGHNVTVLTRGNSFKTHYFANNNIKIYALPYIPFFPPFHLYYHGLFINKFISKHETKYDLIHLHSPLIPLIKSKLPIVTTVHSTWSAEAKAFKGITDWYTLAVFVFSRFFIKNEIQQFKKSAALIAIAESVKNEVIANYNIKVNKIILIHNSIKVNLRKSKKNHKKNTVLTVSRLVKRKGILDLIDAASQIKRFRSDIKFIIIGKGPLELNIRNKIRTNNLSSNISLLGEIGHSEIIKHIDNANIVVIPSHYEGLPLILLEAMSRGKPVVATKINGILEVINHKKNGYLIDSKNPDSLSKAIIHVLDNVKLQKHLSNGALSTIAKFDPIKAATKTIKIYRHIINN